jgi:hypothetical protein
MLRQKPPGNFCMQSWNRLPLFAENEPMAHFSILCRSPFPFYVKHVITHYSMAERSAKEGGLIRGRMGSRCLGVGLYPRCYKRLLVVHSLNM